MRRPGFALLVLGVLLALPAGASAHSLVRSAGGLVSYVSADATSLNTLVVRQDSGRIEFRDESVDGGMDPGQCVPGDVGADGYIVQTFCSLEGVRRVRVDLGDREDRATVTLAVPVTLLGGSGADAIAGGEAADEVSGGEGNDSVAGGAGDDVLSGDAGADVLDGGDGADRIAARDGEADRITCGPGVDTLDADGADVVAADCEYGDAHRHRVARAGRRRRQAAGGRCRRSDRATRGPLARGPRLRDDEQAGAPSERRVR